MAGKQILIRENDEGQFDIKFLDSGRPISKPDMKRIARSLAVAHRSYLVQGRMETRRRMAEGEKKARGTSNGVNDGGT